MTLSDRIRGETKQYRTQRVFLGEVEGDLSGGSVFADGVATARTLGEWMAEGPQRWEVPSLSIAFSGAQTSAKSFLYANPIVLSGTGAVDATSGVLAPFQINVGSDTVDTGGAGLTHLSVRASASAGRTGARQGIQGFVIANGAPETGDDGYIIGVNGMARAANNQGGTGSNYGSHNGAIFGGGSNAFTTSAGSATFLKSINGHEFNTTLATNNSSADKYGISIVKGSADAVRGTYDDAAISINDQDGSAVGWLTGIKFGAYAHQWAFAADSTLIGVEARTSPTPASATALYGIDMSALTVTAGGAGVVMPLITPASAGATGKAGSIVWDADYIYVCTATNTWKRVAIATWP